MTLLTGDERLWGVDSVQLGPGGGGAAVGRAAALHGRAGVQRVSGGDDGVESVLTAGLGAGEAGQKGGARRMWVWYGVARLLRLPLRAPVSWIAPEVCVYN